MHFVILTELGVAVFDENKCVKSIPFSDPATDYVDIKEERADISALQEFLPKLGNVISVNDLSLLKLLKKNSIEAELM